MKAVDTIAWAAGLFEGEGCIDRDQHRKVPGGKVYYYPRLQLSMTDEDVVRRFRDAVGVGRVYGPYGRPGARPYWRWSVSNRQARRALELLLPFFGERRRAKAEEVLA